MILHGSPVQCKTGIAAGKRAGAAAHYVLEMRSQLDGNRIRYSARWICTSWGSLDVTILPTAHDRKMCVHCLDRARPSVYRCLSASGSGIYIGSSVKRTRRLEQHKKSADWWPLVADVEYEEFPTYAQAYAAEVAAIRAEHPACNRRRYSTAIQAVAA
jgi:hypothetical protein